MRSLSLVQPLPALVSCPASLSLSLLSAAGLASRRGPALFPVPVTSRPRFASELDWLRTPGKVYALPPIGDRQAARSPLASHFGETKAPLFVCRPAGASRIADPRVLEESEAPCAGAQPRLALTQAKGKLSILVGKPARPAECRSTRPRIIRGSFRKCASTAFLLACKPAGTGRIAGPRVHRNPKHPAQVRNLVSPLT